MSCPGAAKPAHSPGPTLMLGRELRGSAFVEGSPASPGRVGRPLRRHAPGDCALPRPQMGSGRDSAIVCGQATYMKKPTWVWSADPRPWHPELGRRRGNPGTTHGLFLGSGIGIPPLHRSAAWQRSPNEIRHFDSCSLSGQGVFLEFPTFRYQNGSRSALLKVTGSRPQANRCISSCIRMAGVSCEAQPVVVSSPDFLDSQPA